MLLSWVMIWSRVEMEVELRFDAGYILKVQSMGYGSGKSEKEVEGDTVLVWLNSNKKVSETNSFVNCGSGFWESVVCVRGMSARLGSARDSLLGCSLPVSSNISTWQCPCKTHTSCLKGNRKAYSVPKYEWPGSENTYSGSPQSHVLTRKGRHGVVRVTEQRKL